MLRNRTNWIVAGLSALTVVLAALTWLRTRPFGEVSTPLVTAAGSRDLMAVKALVEAGADVNQKPKGMLGMSPLIMSVYAGSTEVAMYLLEQGADVNARDKLGRTALIWAVITKGDGNAQLIRKLIEKGADVTVVDHYGATVVAYANSLASTSTEKVKELLETAERSDP